MATHGSPSQSAEDHLERIHEWIEQKGYARVVDIASSLTDPAQFFEDHPGTLKLFQSRRAAGRKPRKRGAA